MFHTNRITSENSIIILCLCINIALCYVEVIYIDTSSWNVYYNYKTENSGKYSLPDFTIKRYLSHFITYSSHNNQNHIIGVYNFVSTLPKTGDQHCEPHVFVIKDNKSYPTNLPQCGIFSIVTSFLGKPDAYTPWYISSASLPSL